MWQLPLVERWLWFTPALSSSPGHVPAHEESCFAEGNVAAVAPTSSNDLLPPNLRPGRAPRPPLHRILTLVEPSRDLLVQFVDLLFDQVQLFQHHLHELTVTGSSSVHAPST